jgi:hypothetical protein
MEVLQHRGAVTRDVVDADFLEIGQRLLGDRQGFVPRCGF